MDTGTGAVHIAPGHGEDDYSLGRKRTACPSSRRSTITAVTPKKSVCRNWSANTSSTPMPTSSRLLRERGMLISGATLPAFLSVLLALKNADHLPRSRTVFYPHRRPPRESARGDQRVTLDPAVGRKSHFGHGGIATRLGDLAPAQLGRAAAGFLFRRRRGDSRTRSGFASWPNSSRSAARTSGSSSMTPRSRQALGLAGRHPPSQRHDRRLDRFAAFRTPRSARRIPSCAIPPTCIWKRPISIAAGSSHRS